MAAIGDLIYRGTAVWKRLVGNTTTTKKFLSQTGNGSASAAPAWNQVADADLSVTDVTTNNVTSSAHGFAPKSPNDATKFLRGDATPTWAVPGAGGSGGDAIVRKTADETITATTTLQNDDELLFPVDASSVYCFEILLLLVAPNTAADWKIGWAVPASATMFWDPENLQGTIPWAANTTTSNPPALSTEGSSFSFSGGVGPSGMFARGVVVTAGTSGNVQFKWAQSTSDAGNSTVKANSFIRYRKIS